MNKHSFLFYIAVVGLLLLGLFGLSQPTAVQAAAPAITSANAYEVIRFGPHDTIVREISFPTASVSGMTALKLSGLKVLTINSSLGSYVCSINGVGDCSGVAPYYWAYYHWDTTSRAWDFSSVGAGEYSVHAGAVEGWVYLGWFDETSLPNLPSAQVAMAVPAAADWLQTQQNANTGGYDSMSDSAEALLAVGSDGYSASSWIRKGGSRSLLAYWMANGTTYAKKGADSAGKLAVGLQSACACWPSSAPHPAAFYNASSGMYANGAGPQSWAILGSLALRDSVPPQAITVLEGMVQGDGGWEWQPGFGSDTNTTALVVQALMAAGENPSSALIVNALAYLKNLQQDDGGMFYDNSIYTTASDADSSAYSAMAILSAGGDPTASGWTKNGNTPDSYLLGLQLSNGSFQWQNGYGANLMATSQTIPALLGDNYLPRANFSISGKVTSGSPATGLAGVKVTLGSYSATTASDGTYTIISIPPGVKGSLIASKAGYIFSPITIAAMNATVSSKNFVATPIKYTISGKVTIGSKGLSGVEIDATINSVQRKVFTDNKGAYTITGVHYNASVILSAKKYGYSFSATDAYPITVDANLIDQNFSATALTLDKSISGTITLKGTTNPLANVLLTLTYNGTLIFQTRTDDHGKYTFPNLVAESGYEILPTMSKYTFTPTGPQSIDLTGASATQDYSATRVK